MERLTSQNVFFAFSPDQPAAVFVPAGTMVEFQSPDCFNGLIKSESDSVTQIDLNRANPACGPVYIEEAEPGDTLMVEIHKILISQSGITALFPNFGLLRDKVQAPLTRLLPVDKDRIYFNNGISVPIRAQIGVIGTSPASDHLRTVDVDVHGSNLDCPEIGVGARVYLPVAVPGALLGIGDLHAAQGSGEICGTGVEVEGRVQATLTVIKGVQFPLPIVETVDSWIVLCPHMDFNYAARAAAGLLLDLIVASWKISAEEAFMLMSVASHVGLCSCFEPGDRKVVVKVRMPKLEGLPPLIPTK